MANDVFANGREVSCKAADGKAIASFPDVCFTPPENPATPPGVPIPYPNTGMATDATSGSKKVKISNKEVMLKNKSYFKKSMGDEAGSAAKKGVITSVNRGKVYFTSWSMDVKFEGQNVVRHLDLTTHNHASQPGQTPPWPYIDEIAIEIPIEVNCKKVLARYPVESYKTQKEKKGGVYAGAQSHHVIQNSHFQYPRGETLKDICPEYSEDDAPCIPLEDGTDPNTAHGRISQMQKADAKIYRKKYREEDVSPTYSDARNDAKKQLTEPSPGPGLSDKEAECILVEVDKYFEKSCGGKKGDDLKLRPPGMKGKGLPKAPSSGSGAGGAL